MLTERQLSGNESAEGGQKGRTKSAAIRKNNPKRGQDQSKNNDHPKLIREFEHFREDSSTARDDLSCSQNQMFPCEAPLFTKIPRSLDLNSRNRRNISRMNSPRHRPEKLRCVHSDRCKVKPINNNSEIPIRKIQSADARLNEPLMNGNSEDDRTGGARDVRRSIGFDFLAGERQKCCCCTCSGGTTKKDYDVMTGISLTEKKGLKVERVRIGSQYPTVIVNETRRVKPPSSAAQSVPQTRPPPQSLCERYRPAAANKNDKSARGYHGGSDVSSAESNLSREDSDSYYNIRNAVSDNTALENNFRNLSGNARENNEFHCPQKHRSSIISRSSGPAMTSPRANQQWAYRRKRVRISNSPIFLKSPLQSPRRLEKTCKVSQNEFSGPSILRVKDSNQSLSSESSQSTVCSRESCDAGRSATYSSSIESISNNEAILPQNIPSSISGSAMEDASSVANLWKNINTVTQIRSKPCYSDSEVQSAFRRDRNLSESTTTLLKRSSETQMGNRVKSEAKYLPNNLPRSASLNGKFKASFIPIAEPISSICRKPGPCAPKVGREKVASCPKLVGKQEVVQKAKEQGIRCVRMKLDKCANKLNAVVKTPVTNNSRILTEGKPKIEHISVIKDEKKSGVPAICKPAEVNMIQELLKTSVSCKQNQIEPVNSEGEGRAIKPSKESLNSGAIALPNPPLCVRSVPTTINDTSPSDKASSSEKATEVVDTSVNSSKLSAKLSNTSSLRTEPNLNSSSHRAVNMISHVVSWINRHVVVPGHLTPRGDDTEQVRDGSGLEDLVIDSIQGWDVAHFIDGPGYVSVVCPNEASDKEQLPPKQETVSSEERSTNVPSGDHCPSKNEKTNSGKKDAKQELPCTVIDIEDTLFTRRLTGQFEEAVKVDKSEDQLEMIRDLLCKLPAENLYVLEWLITRHVVRQESCEQFGQLLKIEPTVLARMVELGDTIFDECF